MPKISFATSELSYTETPTMVNVSVILDPINPYGSTQVDYGTFTGLSASALGALPDFEVVSGTVSFEAAVQSTNTISVTLFDDYIDEDNESFQLFLRNPRGASLSGNEQITITITDDDEAGIHLSPPLLSLAEGGPATHYSLTLESQPTAPVVVSLESYPQIQASPSAVTFTSATWDMPQMVDVLAIDDATAEGVHNGKIEHQVASIDQKYDGLATLAVTAGIVDNDRASLHVSTAALTITEGITGLAGTHVYSIGLDTQPTQIITVAVEVDSPIVATPRFLQFGPENWNIEQTVAISTTDDGQIINAAGPIVHRVISNDPAYSKVSIADVALTYVDNDHPEVNVVASNPFTILEGGDERSYEISLNSAPEQPVTIQLTTDSDQVVVVPETITFDRTNWDQSQPLTVTIIDDEEMEGNRESTIEHNTQSSDPSYSALKPAQVVVRIVDNDVMLYLPSYVQGK